MQRILHLYLRGFALLVPSELRREWIEEWQAELTCRHRQMQYRRVASLKLAFDASGAMADACWHLREEWRLDMWLQDLRYGFRALVRKPGFTALAVLTLALGIGATTAIFSVVDAVLLRPLPYSQPDRLMALWEKNPLKGWHQGLVAGANFLDWREQSMVFSDMAGTFGPTTFSLTGAGEPRSVTAQKASGNLFDVLGVSPILGQGFQWSDTWQGAQPRVVMSHGLWQGHFGGDPSILGQTIQLDQENYTVAGVMPPGFSYPQAGLDVWTMLDWNPAVREQVWFRRAHFLKVVARLEPGVTLAEAEAELETIAARLEQTYPETNTQMGAGATRLHEWTVGDTRRPLLLVLGAVALVLLIACANVVNLLLVRSGARSREMAVRSALGAGGRRLIRQLATENVMLALGAGVLGAALGRWGLQALIALSPKDLPRLHEVALDARVFFTAFAVTLLATSTFALFPAIAGSRFDLRTSLHEGGRSLSSSGSHRRLRGALIVAEVAVALLLVLGAGLLAKSFYRLYQVDPGFDAERILAVNLSLPSASYKDIAAGEAFFGQLRQRLLALPGVENVARATDAPFLAAAWTGDFIIKGRENLALEIGVQHVDLNPEFLRTLGIPLVAGRFFTDTDDTNALPVIVVNETLVREFFGGEDPLGRQVTFRKNPGNDATWLTVVGVVEDWRLDGIRAPIRSQVYQPLAQRPNRTQEILIRTSGDPRSLVPWVRDLVREIDDDLPLMRATALSDAIASNIARERFVMLLLATFGFVALLLASVGIYGVIAVAVHQRTREIGIRLALGATRGDVVAQVTGEGMRLVLAGFAVGLVATFAVSRSLDALLYEISPTDPLTYALVSVVLLGAGLTAALIPARRASRIDPTTTLRCE